MVKSGQECFLNAVYQQNSLLLSAPIHLLMMFENSLRAKGFFFIFIFVGERVKIQNASGIVLSLGKLVQAVICDNATLWKL